MILRGRLLMMAVKLPGSPSRATTSLLMSSSTFGFLPTSTSLGAMMHMEQSLVGNVLSSCAIVPPIFGFSSTR